MTGVPLRLLRYGEAAVLAETDGLDAVAVLHAAVRSTPPPGTVELVPAARTLLVTFDPGVTTHAAVAEALRAAADVARPGRPPAEVPGRSSDDADVTLDVDYDGPDLDDIARRLGLSVQEVVRRHTAPTYRVAFGGFAPGFAYVQGLDPLLHLPRRDSPRTAVPAGSVAIAAEWTAVYPTASPGGWHLLGRTATPVWDVDRDPPSLFVPGARVRFRARGTT